MSNYEKFLNSFFLFAGTLTVSIESFGYDFFINGDYLRSFLFALLSAACLMTWLAPLSKNKKPLAEKAMRVVTVFMTGFMFYHFVQTEFLTSLPPISP